MTKVLNHPSGSSRQKKYYLSELSFVGPKWSGPLLISLVSRCEIHWEECDLGPGDPAAEQDPGCC